MDHPFIWAERVEFPISLVITLVPAGTGVAVFGWIDGYDFSTQWLIFCFSWAFLSIAAGQTHMIIQAILKTSVKGKLQYVQPSFRFVVDGGRFGVEPGIRIINVHDGPIFYEVRSFDAVANNRSPSHTPTNSTTVGVLNRDVPHEIHFATISDIGNAGDVIEGRYSFEIYYGKRPDKLIYPLKMAFNYVAGPVLDAAGNRTNAYGTTANFARENEIYADRDPTP